MANDAIWNQIKGNWNQFAGSVRERWGELTDDEVHQIKGDRQQLAGMLQKKYGKTQQEINQEIENWADNLKV